MQNTDPQQSTRITTIWLILLNIGIGIITNIATNILPPIIKPYLWLSWPTLGILIIVYLYLNWFSNEDYQGNSHRSNGETLAQTAIQQVTPQSDSPVKWLFSIPARIDLYLHRKKVNNKIKTLEKTADNYSKAVVRVEALKANGQLASDIADKAIEKLNSDYVKEMDRIVKRKI